MILVFAHRDCYPGGGMNDLVWYGDSIENFLVETKNNNELLHELKISDSVDLHNTDELTIKYRVKIDKDTNIVSVEWNHTARLMI